MDLNWYKQAHGHMTNGKEDFQNQVDKYNGSDKLIIIDFFMPACGWCIKFMPSWNQIYDEFKAEYGDKIEFLKVNGTDDSHTANRYRVRSFPTFGYLEPGTNGKEWHEWTPMNRDYATMKKWIKGLMAKHHITNGKSNDAASAGALANAADKLHNNVVLAGALPIGAEVPNAAMLLQQHEENKHMQTTLESIMRQQTQQTAFAK